MNLTRVRTELRDLVECVVVPSLALVLPWRWAYWVFDQILKRTSLYIEGVDQAFDVATKVTTFPVNASVWKHRMRMTRLLDAADYYLSKWRTSSWIRGFTQVEGEWLKAGQQFVALTFHWGAGMFALEEMKRSGVCAHMLVNAANPEHFRGRYARFHYIRHRIKRIEQLLARPTLDAMGSLRPIVAALRGGTSIVAVIDVPTPADASAQAVTLMEKTVWVPRALMRAAIDNQLPVLVYLSEINFNDGTRHIRIHAISPQTNVETLAKAVFKYLDKALEQEPAAWHLWSEWHRFHQPTNTK